jgi:hypothetical protein
MERYVNNNEKIIERYVKDTKDTWKDNEDNEKIRERYGDTERYVKDTKDTNT